MLISAYPSLYIRGIGRGQPYNTLIYVNVSVEIETSFESLWNKRNESLKLLEPNK